MEISYTTALSILLVSDIFNTTGMMAYFLQQSVKHLSAPVANLVCCIMGFGLLRIVEYKETCLRWGANVPSLLEKSDRGQTRPQEGLPQAVIDDLRAGSFAGFYKYIMTTVPRQLNPAEIRCILAAQLHTAPESIRNWFTSKPFKAETIKLEVAVCYSSSTSIFRSCCLDSVGKINGDKLPLILGFLCHFDADWVRLHAKELYSLFRSSDVLVNFLTKPPVNVSTLPDLIATNKFKGDATKLVQTIGSLLQGDAKSWTEQPGLLTQIAEARQNAGLNECGHRESAYLDAINHARMLFENEPPSGSGKMKLSSLKLATYVAAHIESARTSEKLAQVLTFAEATPELALDFLKQSANFKGLRQRESIVQAEALTELLAKSVLSSDSIGTLLGQLDEVLPKSSVPSNELTALRAELMAKAKVKLSATAIQALPAEWRSGAIKSTLQQAAATGGMVEFVASAKEFPQQIPTYTLLATAMENNLEPFTTNNAAFANLVEPGSLNARTLQPYVANGGADFALAHPALLSSPNELAILFKAWASQEPFEASAYIANLPRGIQRNTAITGLVESLDKYDPAAAAQWREELQRSTKP